MIYTVTFNPAVDYVMQVVTIIPDATNRAMGEKIAFVTEKDNFFMALSEVSYYVMMQLTEREGFPMNLVVKQRNKYFILQQTRTSSTASQTSLWR